MFAEQRNGLVQACAAGAVFVEEVAGEEDKVDILVPGDLEDLAKCVYGVLAAHWVLLGIAEVVVRCDENAEAAASVSDMAGRKTEEVEGRWTEEGGD